MIKLNERTIFFSHHLVVEPLLDGSMSSCEPAAVLSLQLKADGLLLGGNDVLPGGGLLLHAPPVVICAGVQVMRQLAVCALVC